MGYNNNPGGIKMRRKCEAVLCFEFNLPKGPKPVLEYCEDYVAISQVLDANPEILDAFHEDVKKLSAGGRRGRKGDYTSENLLRALIVQSVEGLSLRKTIVKIGTTPFLQDFLRLRKKVAMDHTFLDKCRLAIRPATQRKINEITAQYAIRIGAVDPTVIRADTTVVDADIHYPTDSSLLWDVWRVAARMLADARGLDPALSDIRFHTLKIKGLHLFITRYGKSTSAKRQRAVKECPMRNWLPSNFARQIFTATGIIVSSPNNEKISQLIVTRHLRTSCLTAFPPALPRSFFHFLDEVSGSFQGAWHIARSFFSHIPGW